MFDNETEREMGVRPPAACDPPPEQAALERDAALAENNDLRLQLDDLLQAAGEAFRLIEEGWRSGWVPKVAGMSARDALRKAIADASL